jgi:hypothetical protein
MVGRRLAALFSASAVLGATTAARATDPFEIQVYDGTANAPMQPGLELHLNYVANGLREPDGATVARQHQAHMTLEPSLGILPWWELGAYFQTAVVPGAGFEYAGAKLRSKFVTPPTWHPNLRLGANFELALIPERFDHDRWSTELRPIVAWENARWLFALNANVSTPLAGDGFRDGPAFEPAAMAVVKLWGVVGVGVEYYSGLGPFSDFSPVAKQEHYLYEVANLLAVDALELNVGVGEGLTSGSNKLVFKLIVGWEFDTTPPGSATDPSSTARSSRALRGASGRFPPRQSPPL